MTTQTVKLSIKKNDQVQVISGRDKGKTGKVLNVDTKNGRITVEKLNLVKRHTKPTQQNPTGGIVEKELSLDYSNVLLMCAKCNRGTRHGAKFVDKAGKKGADAKKIKVRVCKRCGESVDNV